MESLGAVMPIHRASGWDLADIYQKTTAAANYVRTRKRPALVYVSDLPRFVCRSASCFPNLQMDLRNCDGFVFPSISLHLQYIFASRERHLHYRLRFIGTLNFDTKSF